MQSAIEPSSSSWLDKPFFEWVKNNWEVLVFAFIVVLAIVSRFYDLGMRVMSHDESLHTYYSWKLYRGEGYQHTPMMHGPLQFHLVALSYFLFGDSDFTARIPHVIASILSVVFLWQFRRYLGRVGAMVAAALWVISPYMLYYGRYARNEAFVGLFGLVTIWAILRYLEKGEHRYLYWLTGATVLHFTTKETAFIYTAQALLFLGFYFLNRILRQDWAFRTAFMLSLLASAAAFVGVIGVKVVEGGSAGTPIPTPIPGGAETAPVVAAIPPSPLVFALLGVGVFALLLALFFLVRGYTREKLLQERSFDMMLLIFTLILPHLVAFPVSMMGWVPTDYSTDGLTHMAIFLIPITLIAIGIGVWWNWQLWLRNALLFYGIFVVLYTTLFTNGGGFFTGLVGSLGYWIEQQGVQRGSQPWYYYLLIQVPIYEYLPLLGSIFAAGLYLFIPRLRGKAISTDEIIESSEAENFHAESVPSFTLPLLLFWAITSMAAFTIAGEKMPWLTYHITFGMILLSGWSIGALLNGLDWHTWNSRNGWLSVVVLLVFLLSLPVVVGSLLGADRPFMGKELPQLQATSLFITAFVTSALSAWGLFFLLKRWSMEEYARFILLGVFGFFAVLTIRVTITANFVNYDQANEYLVYAHSARGVKDVMKQVEEISLRTTDGLAMLVAYDDDTSWPMTWYMRNFTNQRYYGNTPGKDLRDVTAIIVGDNNYSKIEPVVGKMFYRFDYIRMVWPNQDYFDLNWERIKNVLTDPIMRDAIFDIWLNRDFKAYGLAIKQDLAINNWNPADRMRFYLRKDIASKIWEYGTVASVSEESFDDPYQKNHLKLEAVRMLGANGKEPGQFQSPRNIAVAKDGSLYVADTGNHRIQHLSAEGKVIKVWGSPSTPENLAPGTFNEPWGIAIAPDNTIYVADTWNHRIQKFSADGEFISSWGRFGQAETHDTFWGPREVAVDAKGRVYITDTGNKRVVVFSGNGEYITEFGGFGLETGKLDEPVGLAINADQQIFVADTWNQRIQAFQEQGENLFLPLKEWEVSAWYGQSLDNKPYLAIDAQGHVFSSDPEGYRILEFDSEGKFIRSWGDFSEGLDGFGIVNGLAADGKGGVWVCDASNHRLLYFVLP